MQVIERLEKFPSVQHPIILAIGNFDGMHRGHSAVLKKARSFIANEGEMTVLTFQNHPSEILRPDSPVQLLCTLPHKIKLLEQAAIEKILLLPFTRYLAQHSAASFIEHVRQFIPFSHLVLGHDATIGRDRQGNRDVMQDLGEQWGFQVFYQEEYRFEGQPVSSTRIREAVKQGNLELVENLLDRPYSIYQIVSHGENKGKTLGFPTANLDVSHLCIPPLGVYAVQIRKEQQILQGIANLGFAPTLNTKNFPVLEVHIFDYQQDLYNQPLEVCFKKFIRSEKKFDDLDSLQKQIQQDIQAAKLILSYS